MVSPVLGNVLASRRSLLNQRVVQARRRWPALDLAALAAFIEQTLDPLCLAAHARDENSTTRVAEIGFEMGLELVAQGLAGPAARVPWVDKVWQQLAAPADALLVDAPLETLGSLANAVIRMADVHGVRVEQWINTMASVAPHCTSVEMLRGAGGVCAWQCGMAHLRDAALAQAACLPDTVAAAACAVASGQWASIHARLRDDRWWTPMATATETETAGQLLGGFCGFGGPFPVPPQVRASANGFIARCGERHFLLVADVFGAVVLPASAAEFSHASDVVSPQVVVDAQGARVGERRIRFAAPVEGLGAVSGAGGTAFFSPFTHNICIVPGAA